MMQVQKGQVKYQDRTDIICEYGIVSGKQYYFMTDGKLSNGNIIATTVLVEAIDSSVVPTSVGVIDSDGNIVIPFENKRVKPINDHYLLVERSVPKSASVLASQQSKNDPMTATKLVTTSATIKDSLTAKMGVNGRFLFTDPTSEAAIYDLEGKNVIADNYYSFIATNDNTFYFSKDVVGSPIVEYNYNEMSVPNTSVASAIDSVDPDVVNTPLDVTTVQVDESQLESAINDQANHVDDLENSEAADSVLPEEVVVQNEDHSTDEVDLEKEEKAVEDLDAGKDSSTDLENTKPIDGDTVAEGSEESTEDCSEAQKEISADKNSAVEEKIIIPSVEEEDIVTNKVEEKKEESIEEVSSDEVLKQVEPATDIFGDKYDIFGKKDDDMGIEDTDSSDFKIDLNDFTSRSRYDDYLDDSYYNEEHDASHIEGDSIIRDVATTMKELIRQNKEQRGKIGSLESKNDNLERKIVSFESRVKTLEGKNQTLENQTHQMNEKIHDQADIIDKQNREINLLRNQLKGKKDLARLLETAKDVLEQRSYDDYDEDRAYRRRAA